MFDPNRISHPILKYPWRSPLVLPYFVRDIIENKIVCGVGCAFGDLLFEFYKYCKYSIGYEQNLDRVFVARSRGFFVEDTYIPEADVYYVWIEKDQIFDILPKIVSRTGKLILAEEDIIPELKGEFRTFKFREEFDRYAQDEGHIHSTKEFRLQILDLPCQLVEKK